MRPSRVLAVIALLAAIALWLFLSRDTGIPQVPSARDSIDRASDIAEASALPELPVETRRTVDAPPPEVTAVNPVAPAVASARLHVVDDATGAELDGISLYRVSPFESMGIILPAKGQLSDCVGNDLASPIVLRPEESGDKAGPTIYFACNQDHAWERISILPTSGGDFVLRLKPGGALRVKLAGAAIDSKITLRLRRLEASPQEVLAQWSMRELGPGQPLSLDLAHLATDAYSVRAELGGFDQPQILAMEDVAIVTGQRVDVALSISEKKPERVELYITVLLDPGWNLDKFSLDVRNLDAPDGAQSAFTRLHSSKMARDFAGAFVAEPVAVEAGRFRFTVPEARFDLHAAVGPSHVQHVIVEVPAPGSLVVEVREQATGVVVANAELEWTSTPSGPTVPGGRPHSATPTVPGRFEFRAPLGKLHLWASGGERTEFARTYRSIEVTSGTNQVTINLASNYHVLVALQEEGTMMPWSMAWMDLANLERVGDSGWRSGLSQVDSRTGLYSFHFADPGLYRFNLRKLPGYQEVSPIEFNVGAERTVEHTIQLVRD